MKVLANPTLGHMESFARQVHERWDEWFRQSAVQDYIEGVASSIDPLATYDRIYFFDSDHDALLHDWNLVRGDLLAGYNVLAYGWRTSSTDFDVISKRLGRYGKKTHDEGVDRKADIEDRYEDPR